MRRRTRGGLSAADRDGKEDAGHMGRKKPERIVKSKVNWKKRSQVNRLHLVMTFVMIAICISAAAGVALAVIEIFDPFAEPEPVSSAVQSDVLSSQAESSLPVYENDFNLVLANSKNALPDSFSVQLTTYQGVEMDERIVPALEAMLEAAAGDGVTLQITACYRSAEEQDAEYRQRVDALMENGSTRVRAEDSVQSSFGRGGYNEAQTGMTVTFASEDEDFASGEASRWLSKNAIRYGFTLRFPQGSEDETGRDYDPASYRYVGTQNAEKMRQLSMCLEEYAAYVGQQQG